jgi:hypothetical protein
VVQHAQRDRHLLAGGRRQAHTPLQPLAPVGDQQVALSGHPVVEQGRVHRLQPGGVLVGQRLGAAHLGADLQHLRRRDPGLRQPPRCQQLAQVAGVCPVGLGPPLGATQRAGVGRLGQVRGDPGALQLLDHIPPAGAALQRERGLPAGELLQPGAQMLTVRRGESAALALAAVGVDPVLADLAAVHLKPTYDCHRDLLRAPPTGLQHHHRA